jgi:tetratricopeptide (TPR) repeat protein/tRNA A-37 threonylcarbamoyl transferase component Bud32
MNQLDHPEFAAENASLESLLHGLRDQFEADWEDGLRSGQRPVVASYLERCPVAERAALKRMLEEIEKAYLKRFSAHTANLAGQTMEFSTGEEVAPETVGFLAEKTDPDLTIDSIPGGPLKAHDRSTDKTDPNMTLDSLPPAEPARARVSSEAAADFNQTMDSVPSDYAPTLDPDEAAAAAAAAAEISEDQAYIAGHEILGELGRGGMGVVYKARQLQLNRMVALKMVLAGAHAAPEQLKRFQTEAEAVARLKHPNIVQIYEVGEYDGLPFFSLEYVDGGTLASRIGGKPQPPRDAARVVERLADAMSSAHRQDIIHRDLKPANVLLTTDGDPKITDFGLAKRLEDDSSQTRSGTIMGTPSYMAPEQARGDSKTIGPKSDQYALGAILYEMLTGRPPFQGTTILETLEQVQRQEPVPPCRLQPKVPRDLETVCLKCLQKEPEKRYPTTSALAADLMRFLGGETIMARPVGQIEKGWRWCRRNPRVAVLTMTVLILLVTAGSAFTVLAARASRERQETAERQARERKTLEEVRQRTEQRIDQATEAIRSGNHTRAADLLRGADETLDADDLADVRDRLRTLQAQIDLYGRFQKLLDNARYTGLFGGQGTAEQARAYCRQLIHLYDDIEQRTGEGAVGLPPLTPQQQELFREDAFEAFLICAWVENNAAPLSDAEAQKAAAQQAVLWLARAEKLLPPTRALFVHRSGYLGTLNDRDASEADRKRALAIEPTSAIDLFWRGVADRLRAREAQKAGDLKGAQEYYRKAIGDYAALLQLRPEHFWAYLDWANCQYQLQSYDDAVVGYTACIHLKPDAPWPYQNRASSHLQLGQHDQAIQDCTQALLCDPKSVDSYITRAQAHLGHGAKEPAFSDFARAIEQSSERSAAVSYYQRAEAYRQVKQFPEALQDYDQTLKRNGKFAEAHLGRGLILLEQQQLEPALHAFDQAIEANPKHIASLLQRAKLRRLLKQFDGARADYDQVLALRPNDVQVYQLRAQVHQDMKLLDRALSDYNAMIALRPDDPKAYAARAMIHAAQSHYSQARDDCSAAIRLAANDPAVVRLRGALNLRFLRDLDGAFEDWSRLTKLQPANAEAFFRVAAIELGRKQYPAALRNLDKALELNPKYTEVLWSMAQVYHWQGNLEKALEVVNVTVEKLPPDKPEGLNVRGDIYRSMGRLDDAAADYRRLIQLKPALPDAYISLAGIYLKQGKIDEAIRCYDEMAMRVNSATGILRRAEFRRNREEFDEAIADCEEAAKRDSKLPLVELVRATIDAQRGHPHEAVADAERILAAASVRDGQLLYTAACVMSLASRSCATDPANDDAMRRSKQYAERAVALLTESLEQGFHDFLFPEHNRMAADPALVPIQDDIRVGKLLAHRP